MKFRGGMKGEKKKGKKEKKEQPRKKAICSRDWMHCQSNLRALQSENYSV